ncbi:serine hydrolase domain-containing protein [Erythrobacter sp. T5W1-R]|uniref:serine hydrolase domain-containing protein n=1 Tax=Erythrobacter sp. T5W1-R TaxID=3101752 RepID=UPI002AFECA3D|nr:serine hydrolase domain-containing protein [Erythrobacter sp. T5W1-R]MEA1617369.1 serine hydrolase domain-containing protein [Erythrobacter sp. T5W1-R]
MTIARNLAGALALLAVLVPVPTLAAECAIVLPPDFNGVAAVGAGTMPQVVVQGQVGEAGTAAIDPATRFNLGSVGKMMTATAIAQLVEQGLMAFDDPLGRHVAGLPPELATLRIEQLLSHTAGLSLFLRPDLVAAINDAPTATALVPLVIAERRGEPGAFRYSNAGYVLLGAAIEAASGLSHDEYISRNILPAAGITPQPLGWQAGDAEGIDPAEQDFARAITRVRPWPAGGIVLSAADLWRFGRALAGGRLVRPETLEAMMRGGIELRAATPERPASRYGLGLGVSGEGSSRVIGHTGGAPGIDVSLRIHPASGRVVAVMSNHSGSDDQNASSIAKAILAELESGLCAEQSQATGANP